MPNEDVNEFHEDGTPKSPEEIAAEVSGGDTTTAPGSKTDSTLLLKSLQDEREKRRQLEEELELLKNTTTSTEIITEEGKALQREIQENRGKIASLTEDLAKKDVLIDHPILSEKWEDFQKFRSDPENQGMSLKTAAKAYLVENGLLEQKRKGMEKPTGGDRVPPSTKMSAEDVKILRETNFKKYQEMLDKGLIDI